MTNHILLRIRSLLSIILLSSLQLSSTATMLAQTTKPETKSEPHKKIQPAQTQQINRARSGRIGGGLVDGQFL